MSKKTDTINKDLLRCCYNATGVYETIELLNASNHLPGLASCAARLKAAIASAEEQQEREYDATPPDDPTLRFTLDGESGFVWDAEDKEWLTSAEEVFDAMAPFAMPPALTHPNRDG